MQIRYQLPKEVESVINKIKRAGFEIYIVGGAVRDVVMDLDGLIKNGKQIGNWDFATDAIPEEILLIFGNNAFYDNKFGTVRLKPKDNQIFEITTFRTEKEYSDRRHPDKVLWGKTIEEDLSRRDFTVNAMAFKIKNKQSLRSSDLKQSLRSDELEKLKMINLELIDPYQGQDDLKSQIIRAVGDPNMRFLEDALRLLRAIRFATQLKFTIESNTFEAIKNNASQITEISGERIRDEIFKILEAEFASDGFWLLRNSELLSYIFPELEKCFGVEQKSVARHHIYDVGTHCFKSLEYCLSKDPLVKFATLLHDVGKPLVVGRGSRGEITFYNHEVTGAHIAREIANRLHLSRKMRDKLITLVRWHQFSVDEATTPAAVRRFIKRVGVENISDMIDLRKADRLGGGLKEATGWRLNRWLKMIGEELHPPFKITELAVDGHDVMKILEISPGPRVGKILNQLFEEVEEDKKKNTREYLLKRLGQIKKIS